MAGTPIGGLRIDLQLNSAAFIRDIAKTNAAIASNTRTMGASLTKLQTTANRVGAAFTGWLTLRAAKRVIAFLDQSIELASKLDNELGRAAKAFATQAEVMNNAFKLGLAKGFMEVLATGASNSVDQLQRLAKAGEIAGNVLGTAFMVVVDIFTILLPEAINLSLAGINKLIESLNSWLAHYEAIDNLFGLSKSYGRIPSIPNLSIDLADSSKLAADAAKVTTAAINEQNEAMKRAGDEFHRMAELQRDLYNDIRTPMEEYQKRLSEISAAQLNAADTAKLQGMAQMQLANTWLSASSAVSGSLAALFKENKAVAIANAVINTAEAITAALKNPPGPPFSYVYAAAAAIAGAAQIATIMSAQPGTSKAIKTPSGGSAAAKAGATSKGGGGQGNGQTVFLNITGDSFGPEHFRKMVEGLNGSLADGAEFRMAS